MLYGDFSIYNSLYYIEKLNPVIDSMGVRMCACSTGNLVYIYIYRIICCFLELHCFLVTPVFCELRYFFLSVHVECFTSPLSLSPNKKVDLDILPEFAVRRKRETSRQRERERKREKERDI